MRMWPVEAYPGSWNVTPFFVPQERSWWTPSSIQHPSVWASVRRLFKWEGPEVVLLLRLGLALFLVLALASPSLVL
jgi:hypothetical protein